MNKCDKCGKENGVGVMRCGFCNTPLDGGVTIENQPAIMDDRQPFYAAPVLGETDDIATMMKMQIKILEEQQVSIKSIKNMITFFIVLSILGIVSALISFIIYLV